MYKTYLIAIIALICVLVLAWAVFRAPAPRELILKRNGIPLANLKADVLPSVGGATALRTSTDQNGRLDLGNVPAEAEMIAITLWDDTGPVFNGDIMLPLSGSCTIDFQGNRTVSTTTTYVDFGLFKVESQTGQETVQHTGKAAPASPEIEPPLPVDRAQSPVDR